MANLSLESQALQSPHSVNSAGGKAFVYLAYLDDSGTYEEEQEWQVVAAVLIPANSFFVLEFMSALVVEDLIPVESLDQFEEFHAGQLYRGNGVFKAIDDKIRFEAIRSLLLGIGLHGFKVGYGAVNLKAHKRSVYGSAPAKDVAFRRCLQGVAQWVNDRVMDAVQSGGTGEEHTALFIMDEDPKHAKIFQNSYRLLRTKFRLSQPQPSVPFIHDDMYFGDSKYSVGIQIADLCAYFIGLYLSNDPDSERFYKIIEPHLISTGME
jgi:Protein of unknown function (DUF3800)